MVLKSAASVVALGVLFGATTVSAQTTMPPQRTTPTAPSVSVEPKAPVAGQIVVQDANTLLAKELIGQTVYAPDKTKIGSISDLILSKDGKAVDQAILVSCDLVSIPTEIRISPSVIPSRARPSGPTAAWVIVAG